jgi:hypothetical protein
MAAFRYDTAGNWYKGNTHIHTTVSDGGYTPQEVWRMYADLGYDFLFHTDHGVASGFQKSGAAAEAPLLVLDGVELNGVDYGGNDFHVVCLGQFEGIAPGMDFMAAMESCRRQGGLLILAHPHWTGNSQEDALRHGFDGVEVYNHVCWWLNSKGEAPAFWDWMLQRQPNTLGFAADDSHSRPDHLGLDGGWIVVNAAQCTPEAILAAIRKGNFYSSQGPQFLSVECDGKHVRFRSSPVRAAHLTGWAWRGQTREAPAGQTFTDQSWNLPGDWPYMRLVI